MHFRVKSIIKKIYRGVIKLRPTLYITAKISSLPESNWLTGRSALITGGSSGIGLAIAEAFVNAGACVIITGRSNSKLEAAKNKLLANHKTGIRVFTVVMDNSNINDLFDRFHQIIEEVDKRAMPPIGILVNNAGQNCNPMPAASVEEYEQVMDTNLKGAYFLSQYFGKYLIKNSIKGNILNISSASSIRPGNSAYILSKWGLRSLTMGLAKALAPHGITVNAIAPGPTATPMMINDKNTNIKLDRLLLGRYILPEEIANMAVFLVSDMGKSIVGDTVFMTGGAGLLTTDDVPYDF